MELGVHSQVTSNNIFLSVSVHVCQRKAEPASFRHLLKVIAGFIAETIRLVQVEGNGHELAAEQQIFSAVFIYIGPLRICDHAFYWKRCGGELSFTIIDRQPGRVFWRFFSGSPPAAYKEVDVAVVIHIT